MPQATETYEETCEREADIFAMELLMPCAVVKAMVEMIGVQPTYSLLSDDEYCKRLAKSLQVSISLVAVCLTQLYDL
jgi:Zn-dependent peptidase ImmA (M78 family)